MNRPSWIGCTLGGRYVIEALLGLGGMSAVYRANDPNLRRIVAIKLIHPHLSNDPEFVRRFEAEAAAVAQLRHSNIVQVFDFNHDDDVYYMVMEYLPGESLQDRLKTLSAANQRFSLTMTANIVATIADAVAYAHERGVIHRDLKPANVMLMPQGQPVLTDFGVAKIIGGQRHTVTGAVIGTPAYMSPEQVRGQALDGRADIYSLGVMLYEMLAGRPPFEGDSAMTVMLKHINEPVPDIRQWVPDIPEGFVAIIERAMAKQPDQRFQSAGQLAAALTTVAQDPAAKVILPEVGAEPSATLMAHTDAQATSAPPPMRRDAAPPGAIRPPDAYPTQMIAPRRSPPWGFLAGAAAVLVFCIAATAVGAFVIRQFPLPVVPTASATPTQQPSVTVTGSLPTAVVTQPTATAAATLTLPAVVTPAGSSTPAATLPAPVPIGRIVFSCNNGGANQLCLINPDGTGRVQITSGGLDHNNPTLSHDGRTIVYDCETSTAVYETCRMSLDGSGEAQLTHNGVVSIMPVFSPDDALIAYATNFGASGAFPYHIWVMNSDGSNAHRVTFEGSNADAAWSPDGRRISFASTRVAALQLWVANADGSNPRQLTSGLGVQQRHSWASDLSRMAIAIGPKGDWNIYLINPDGSGLLQITVGGNNDRPSFSPDGRWIVFTSRRDGTSQLYTVRADGTQVTRLTQDLASNNTEAYWGP